jgi:hypothetical protein
MPPGLLAVSTGLEPVVPNWYISMAPSVRALPAPPWEGKLATFTSFMVSPPKAMPPLMMLLMVGEPGTWATRFPFNSERFLIPAFARV